MILLCDEGVDRPIVERLRADGHEVVYVAEISPSVSDDMVLAEANRRGAVLVTVDKDFGELVFRQNRLTTGILLLRLAGLGQEQKQGLVSSVIASHGEELGGAFAVLTADKLRIRRQLP